MVIKAQKALPWQSLGYIFQIYWLVEGYTVYMLAGEVTKW